MIYLDIHVVVWLYMGDPSRFSREAGNAINGNELLLSPAVELELTYLHEIGRLKTEARTMINFLNKTIGLKISSLPFRDVIHFSCKQTWTRDPFDRIIVGQSAVQECGLITKDVTIRKHYPLSVW